MLSKIVITGNIISMISAMVLLMILSFFLVYQSETRIAGEYVIEKYVKFHKVQGKEALVQLKKGNLEVAADLLEEWKATGKGDRIYGVKRKLLFNLAKALHSQKRFKELLYWAKIWHELDERDVTARAYWYEALRHSPNRSEEGIEGLAREWQKFPKNKFLTRFYTDTTIAFENDE